MVALFTQLNIYAQVLVENGYVHFNNGDKGGIKVDNSFSITGPGNFPVIYPNWSANAWLGKSDRVWYAVYANSFIQPSDKRLKSNIRKIEKPLDKIKAINGIQYDLNISALKVSKKIWV